MPGEALDGDAGGRQDRPPNASQECAAEEALDPAAFSAKYGTGKKHANAHGKCVSSKASVAATVDQQVAADVTAAKGCKAERAADPAAFTNKYATNKNGRNAFGRCVSARATVQQG